MALITKPPSWAYCTNSMGSTVPAAAPGITVTASATPNTDGASVSILANIGHDVEYLLIGIHSGNTTATEVNMLLDVLTDPAGGSTWDTDPLINDLIAGFTTTPTAGTAAFSTWYHFPIWLKSGHSIGARVRSNTASETCAVAAFAYGGNGNPGSWWCGSRVTTIGVDPASSLGTDHTAGNSSAFSSWANFGSTLLADAGAIQYAIGGASNSTNNLGYFFEFGAGSTRIGPRIFKTTGSAENSWYLPAGPIFCSIPAATQLQVRAACSGTAQALDVAAYAVH